MSTSTEGLYIPQWDLADRLTKSLRVAGLSVQQMAEYLDVHRNTVSAWLNGRVEPSTQTQRLWALRTGVPYVWLTTGEVPPPEPPEGIEPSTFSLDVYRKRRNPTPIFAGVERSA